ncbi:hypothetical protein EW145_g5078 [Phellinidium pouzarii]|uniref:Dihydroxyacetone kinase n=1 Tax=Phellinidium pouzarii TaxID=167371 RepID=A0A4S4L2N6_9AGAM|nr:hypothetical protein EW145_g5078 [Phellinidium pouzarii]
MLGSHKHLLKTPASLVVDSLKGLCAVNSSVELDEVNKGMPRNFRATIHHTYECPRKWHVDCLVFHGVQIKAAVCGNVFASPNASQVRRAIELVENEKGTLIIVKNYTGDVLNFGLAKENFAASHPENINKVKFIIVGDDVSVGRAQGSVVGRRFVDSYIWTLSSTIHALQRGLAGTVLVYKIGCALSSRGASFREVYTTSEWVASRLGTVGAGLEHCHVPGTEPSKSHLSSSEVEIGMGIHNEPGHKRLSPIPTLESLLTQLLDLIMSTGDPERSFLPFMNNGSDEVVLMVNNLGGLSELELGGIAGEAVRILRERAKIHRVLVGTFMTSLNMPGFSLTLLLLPSASDLDSPLTSEILALLDKKVDAPGWKWSSHAPPGSSSPAVFVPVAESAGVQERTTGHPIIAAANPQAFIEAISKACKALIAAEPDITHMDNIAGDGDCGLTLKAGAEGICPIFAVSRLVSSTKQGVSKEIYDGNITGTDIIHATLAIAKQTEVEMGGTSGALYSIFFSSLAQGLVSAVSSHSCEATPEIWSSALIFALNRLFSYTRARPPSRTLVDPLTAFVQSLSTTGLAGSVKAAVDAAEATKDMDAKAGRSAYVESDLLKKEGVPDPGAWGVKVILESFL